jgi:hypothetical protein
LAIYGELAERSRRKTSGLISEKRDQLLPLGLAIYGELAERLLHRS